MLPPVNVVNAVNVVNPDRHSVPDGNGVRNPRLAAAAAALDVLADRGGAKETVSSATALRVADLLAARNVHTVDVLLKLAADFGALIGEGQADNELSQEFTSRLAIIIAKLPAELQQKAEAALGLKPLGISALALAKALANPSSPLAAHIVALIENPAADAAQQPIKNAISTYQQNGAGTKPGSPAQLLQAAQTSLPAVQILPEAAATQKSATANVQIGTGEPKIANSELKGQIPSPKQAPLHAETADQTIPAAKAAKPDVAITVRVGEAVQGAKTAETNSSRADALAPRLTNAAIISRNQPAISQLNIVAISAEGETAFTSAEPAQDQKRLEPSGSAERVREPEPRQRFGAISQILTKVAERSAETLRNLSAATIPASAPPAKPLFALAPGMNARLEPAPEELAQKARLAIRALEGKVIPLFATASTASDVDDAEAERIIRNATSANLAAAAARQAEGAETAERQLAMPRQPEIVPFAQVPYPPFRNLEREARNGEFEHHHDGEDGEQEPRDGESMQQGKGHEHHAEEAFDLEENPFEADEPLKRNPSDTERATHMYQRFGGF